MTKMITMPVVVRGCINGVIRATSVCSAPGSGCFTSTGIGLFGGALSGPSSNGGRGISLRLIEFFAEFFQYLRGPLQRSGAGGGSSQTLDLVA